MFGFVFQEAFQQHLKATAPTAGHQGYASAMPHQQNAFGILRETTANSDNESADTDATQVAASTYQSQLTASTVVNLIQGAEQQFAHLASQQNLMHKNMHQIIAQVNTLSFNQSNAGQERLGSYNSGGHGCGHSRHQQGGAQTAVDGSQCPMPCRSGSTLSGRRTPQFLRAPRKLSRRSVPVSSIRGRLWSGRTQQYSPW